MRCLESVFLSVQSTFLKNLVTSLEVCNSALAGQILRRLFAMEIEISSELNYSID
jgi:hypothetical protein